MQNLKNFNEHAVRPFDYSKQDLGDNILRPLVDITTPNDAKELHVHASEGSQFCQPGRGSEDYEAHNSVRLFRITVFQLRKLR